MSTDHTSDDAPRSIPAELLPGERVITPGSYAPIVVTDPQAANDPPAPDRLGTGRPATENEAGPSTSVAAANPAGAMETSDPNEPDRRLQPADLARAVTQARRRAARRVDPAGRDTRQPGNPGVVTLTSADRPARPSLSRLFTRSRPRVDDAVQQDRVPNRSDRAHDSSISSSPTSAAS